MSWNALMPVDTKRSRGFTLVELMVAMMLSLFLIGGVLVMFFSVRAASMDATQLSRMQENIRFASDYLVRDIRNAGFWDEMTLTIAQARDIQQQLVEIRSNGQELVIRYAGRGHCAERFDDYRVVQNRYFVDANTRELRCEGLVIVRPEHLEPGEDPPVSRTETLVGGVSDARFDVLMANGQPGPADHTCNHDVIDLLDPDFLNDPANRCLGVRVALEFEGMDPIGGGGDDGRRIVELLVTLRNSALDAIHQGL